MDTQHSPQPAEPNTIPAEFSLRDHLESGKQQIVGDRFVKRRSRKRKGIIDRLLGWSVSREAKVYRCMQRLGVPCPQQVECRMERSRFGLIDVAEISMELIPNTVDFRLLATVDCFADLRRNQAWRKRVIREVARWVRHMHRHDLFLCQLHFGNVLVEPVPAAERPKVYFIDITNLFLFPSLRRGYLRSKEIAYLYRDARQWCPLREQIRFMHEYLGRNKLTAEDRQLMRKAVRYALSRWDAHTSTGHPVDPEHMAAAERFARR